MIRIHGTHQQGGGDASKHLPKQLPKIVEEFPEVKAIYHGTLNFSLNVGLVVVSPDHRTKPISWGDPNIDSPEIFDFLRITIETKGHEAEPAWLYIAHHSVYRKNIRMHEVIARPLAHLSPLNAECDIIIDRKLCALLLPYRELSMYVV